MSLLSIEVSIIKIFQSFQPSWLTPFMLFISSISSTKSYFIIVPIVAIFLYFKLYRAEAFYSLFITLGNILNPIIKNFIGRARPANDLVRVLEEKTTNSFPSGHAMGAMIFYGFLIYLTWVLKLKYRKSITIVLIVFILLVGISRIYLGAHWPTDVIGGYILGSIWLVLIIFIYNKTKKTYKNIANPPSISLK